MTTLLAHVLLTLAFVAIATAETCPLYPNGKKLHNGNAVMFQVGTEAMTCTESVQEGISTSDGIFGDPLTHAFQVICRCPRVKAGSCPGICNTGFILAEPNGGSELFGITCSVLNQLLRGIPGDTTCDTDLSISGIRQFCKCKVKVPNGQNMGGGGGVGGNGGAGTGIMGMSGGCKLRLGGLEEHFPPRSTCGLAM
jgi:hypothetical protein